MTSENDIKGLVSLKFLRPWQRPIMVVETNYWNVSDAVHFTCYQSRDSLRWVYLILYVMAEPQEIKRATKEPEQPPFEDCTRVEKNICTKAKIYHFCANGNFVP